MDEILVGYDASESARRAVEAAAQLAQAGHGRIRLTYVLWPVLPVLNDPTGIASAQLRETMRASAEDFLAEQAERLEAKGIRAVVQIVFGQPSEQLAELAKAKECQLVAIGRRGHGAFAHMLLGSVVRRLLHLCPKPVLVVP